ncbi:MAG: ATP synthase F1 subunit epsilon [Prevotellaceae bacterium]|nr:ATP synthase F1 subunit epsilon [Prevotellaceae bacterium]MDY6130185.1 ATP synthase F1 subunit epsilon [Prevotella sp.]
MLKLRIVTPEKVVYDGETESVLVPGTLGSFEILTDHAPLISSLEKGLVEYGTPEGKKQIIVTGGFVEVQKNVVSLCVEE